MAGKLTEATIRPIHPSMRMPRRIPRDMSKLRMTEEQLEWLHRISMSLFADCVNVGVPFQDAIAAVYLSGLDHGRALASGEAS